MMDCFAQNYAVHRVRFVGDTSIFVSGLNEAAGDSSGSDHYTVRMLQCLINICQITGSRYAHHPHRCELMSQTFGAEAFAMPDLVGEPQHVGNLMMPQSCIGVHQGGVTVSLLFFPNGAPHFDILGPTVSLAHRLAQAAKSGGIVVSEAVREACERHASPDVIQFGKQRKIVIRGRGTANTCEVTTATIPVPAAVFQPLGIRYSRLRKYFDEDDPKKQEKDKSGSDSSSVLSRSEISSSHGSER
jgi:class 3 adenylate cyclase